MAVNKESNRVPVTASGGGMFTNASGFTLSGGEFYSAARDVNINPTFIMPKENELEEIRKFTEWITAINFRNIQSDTLVKHTPGTGTWFLKTPEFQRWQSADEKILWVTGMPGGGKTILSSITINYFEIQQSNAPDIAVIYAYCHYNDHYTATDILASFVRQLLESHGFLSPSVKAFCSDHMRKGTRPSKRDFVQLLGSLFRSFRKVFTFIDAVDEISDDVKEELLEAVTSLPTNLLLTSRPLDAFKVLLPDAEVLQIESGNGEDIEIFITKKIHETPRLRSILKKDPALMQEICDTLQEKSQGMFLVAALHIESLKKTLTVKSLRKALESLPSGVHDRYRATWGRILSQPEEEVLLARRAITWLTYVTRSITITELIHALAISNEAQSFDEDDTVDQDLLVTVCCGLIVVEERSRIVRLVHYTTHDFFRGMGSDLLPNPHNFIATSCVTYLIAFNFPNAIDTSKPISRREELYVFLASQPFLDYTYHRWGRHAQAALEEQALPENLEEFINSCSRYPWIYQDEVVNSFDLLLPSHIMASFGLTNFLPTILEKRADRTKKLKRTSVHLTALYGQASILHALLAAPGANANVEDNGQHTALMLASRQAKDEAVRTLLNCKGINVNLQDKRGYTALTRACQAGHRAIVDLLLKQKSISVHNSTGSGRTALGEAVFCGERPIVQLLLAYPNINVNQRDRDQTPLIRACIKGYTPIVDLLISNPTVNMNKRDAHGLTALHYAVKDKFESTVKSLLTRKDLDVNKHNDFGNTALTLAASAGSTKIVQMLLAREDLDVNKPEPKRKDTALHLAANSGHMECVQLLLGRKTLDVNAKNGYGYTAVNLAAAAGQHLIVQFLSSCEGVDLSERDGAGVLSPRLNTFSPTVMAFN